MKPRQTWLVALVMLFAGCLSSTPDDDRRADDSGAQPVVEVASAPVNFDVISRSGGEINVAGLAWIPENVTNRAIVLLHGVSGVKENYWGPLSVSGYSTGAGLATNRTTFAIDLPAYGQSEGQGEATGIEDMAFVIDQVVAHVRNGAYQMEGDATSYDIVAGLGVSFGAFMVGVTQGLHHSFDGIVALSWAPHALGDNSVQSFQCVVTMGDDCIPDDHSDDFVLDRSNATVVEEVTSGYQDPPVGLIPGFLVWNNMAPCVVTGDADLCNDLPSLYSEAASRIEVPILTFMGEQDWYLDSQRGIDETPQSYAASNDLTAEILEEIGHMVLHHDNASEVRGRIAAWLDDRKL